MHRLLRKLNGRQWVNKNRHVLAREHKLTDQEYRLWDLSQSLAGWDKRYEDKFKTVEATNAALAQLLETGWSSSKVSRVKKSLIRKRFIELVGIGKYRLLISTDRSFDNAPMQPKIASTQEAIASTQDDLAPMQSSPDVPSESSLMSFKDNLVSFPKKVIVKQEVRTSEEYQRIYQEGQYQYLTPEYMRWIDENVSEVRETPEEATEKDYVDIFFNGNRDEYNRHIIP